MRLEDFEAFARQGYNRIPLARSLNADLDTPLSAYLKLAQGPYSFLLESVMGGERFGRYSFIGLPARTRIQAHGREIRVLRDGQEIQAQAGDPLTFVDHFMAGIRLAPVEGLPRFAGGLAGYFGYDTIRYIEKRLDQDAAKARPDPMGLPDVMLLLTEDLAVFDNLSGRLTLWVFAEIPGEAAGQSDLLHGCFHQAQARLQALVDQLRRPLASPPVAACSPSETRRDFPQNDFLAAVARAKEYVAAGDAMQVVLAQQLQRPFQGSPLSLYRALRALNPSPYMYYYDMGDFQIAGASPEILVRQDALQIGHEQKTRVTIRPIAGTRPRGKTRHDDMAMEEELKADPKEIAEHVMLIDLARNDVGRIAEVGSVRVNEQMVVERYSHVMHLVSDVEGMLKPNLSAMDVLRASFPAGTLSGAPKIRAMEIIDELEPVKRGLYGGACGYLSWTGEMDLAIAIRTGVLKDQTLYVAAGAGIVADSVAQSEWQETENKARAVIHAAEIAERGLEP